MKKKVIAVTVDTDLTNEQIESGDVWVVVGGKWDEDYPEHQARNVRVLDSD